MTHRMSTKLVGLLKWSIVLVLFLSLGATKPVEAGGGVGISYAILAETARPTDSSIQYDNYYGFLFTTTDSATHGFASYIAQFNLQDGAQILGVTAEGIDKDSSKNFRVSLFRYSTFTSPIYTGLTLPAISSSVTPDGAGRVSVFAPFDPNLSPDLAIVDNAAYSYGAYIELPKSGITGNASNNPALALVRIIVSYKYPVVAFLPQINK